MPTRPQRASFCPTATDLLGALPFIRKALLRCGVAACEVDDVAVDVLVAAWVAVDSGRYVAEPGTSVARGLRAWLHGIARNLASHHRERGRVRCERVTEPAVLCRLAGADPVDLDGKLTARSEIALARALAPMLRSILLLSAEGATLDEISAELHIPVSTAHRKLRRARRELLAATQRVSARAAWRKPGRE